MRTIPLNSIRCSATALFFMLLVILLATPVQAKTVSLVYDDSGSMGPSDRWNPANYAIQIVTALLGDDDTLWLVRMSNSDHAVQYAGGDRIKYLLDDLKVMRGLESKNNGTPYASIRTAIGKLSTDSKENNWLLVVTDADKFNDKYVDEFNRNDFSAIDQDIRDAVINKRAHVVFIVIDVPDKNSQGSKVVDHWKTNGQAKRIDVDAKDLPVKMENLAMLLENSAGDGGVVSRREGGEIIVSSRFPLRRLIVLRQDTQASKLAEAQHHSLGVLDVRRRVAEARNKEAKELKVEPSSARIYHLRHRQVMEAGDDIIRLRFDGDTAQLRYKLIPDVAARFEVSLRDDLGNQLNPDASGYYTYCEGSEIEVEARLLDDSGVPITVGRNDLNNFDVGIDPPPDKTDGKMKIDAKQERFRIKLKPTAPIGLTAHAKYAGYFHFLSDPMQLRPDVCKKDIVLFVKSGLNSGSTWTSPVDAVDEAHSVRIGATVNGSPISAEEFDRLVLRDNTGVMDIEKEGTDWLIRPQNACCALFWSRPSAGRFTATLAMETGRPRDNITLPPPLIFDITPPPSTSRQLWWIACPYVVWIGLLLAAWYLWRLIMKERFGIKAKIWVNYPEERRISLVKLRERASWFLRWFWPSRREKTNVDGMVVAAIGKRGAAILLVGRKLGEQHEIDGWFYDENRALRGLPQADARLRDGGEIAIRHHQPTRMIKYIRRYRYTANASTIPEGW